MAHKKGAGSSRNGRESNSRRLGVKNLADSMFMLVMLLLDKLAQNIIHHLMLE
jgi:ribosomal protein L27